MKTTIQWVLTLFVLHGAICAQAQTETKIDSSYRNWYYDQRMDLYNSIEPRKHDIVFLGNSITERGAWQELIPGKTVANRGIGGDNTFGVLARLDNVIALRPARLFLLIGINDTGRGLPVNVIYANYTEIVGRLKKALPRTQIFVQSVLPLNEDILKYDYLKGKRARIIELNEKLRTLAASEGLVYVDLNDVFADATGALKAEYTTDGIHLTPDAYIPWVDFLKQKKYL